MSICTPGHEWQCVRARTPECDCRCGGANHGVPVAISLPRVYAARRNKKRRRRTIGAKQLAFPVLETPVRRGKRKMKLLTEELKRTIPTSQEGAGDDAIVHAKFFCPWSNWTWYVTEAVAIKADEDESEIPLKEAANDVLIHDVRFFGLVDGFDAELGYFSLRELEAITGPGGLTIERDLHWEPCTLKQVRTGHNMD